MIMSAILDVFCDRVVTGRATGALPLMRYRPHARESDTVEEHAARMARCRTLSEDVANFAIGTGSGPHSKPLARVDRTVQDGWIYYNPRQSGSGTELSMS